MIPLKIQAHGDIRGRVFFEVPGGHHNRGRIYGPAVNEAATKLNSINSQSQFAIRIGIKDCIKHPTGSYQYLVSP